MVIIWIMMTAKLIILQKNELKFNTNPYIIVNLQAELMLFLLFFFINLLYNRTV